MFVTSPAMRALKSIEIPNWNFLETVAEQERSTPLRHLSLSRPPRKKLLQWIAEALRFAGIDALSVYFHQDTFDRFIDELVASKLVARLRSVAVQAWMPSEPPVLTVLESIARLPTSVQRIAYLMGDSCIELRRDGARHVVLADRHTATEVAAVLPRLPSTVSEVHVREPSEAVAEAIERAASERPDIAVHVAAVRQVDDWRDWR